MFEIQQEIKDIGLYLTDCLTQEEVDLIVNLSKSPEFEIKSCRIGPYVEVSAHTKGEKKIIFEKIDFAVEKAMGIYLNHFGLKAEDYKVSDKVYWIKTWEIGMGIGHHSDSWDADGEELVPAVTVLLYLSSDYEGGEIVIIDEPGKNNPEKDLSIKPVSGSMIVFKSQTVHKVNPVLSGIRISTDIPYMN